MPKSQTWGLIILMLPKQFHIYRKKGQKILKQRMDNMFINRYTKVTTVVKEKLISIFSVELSI